MKTQAMTIQDVKPQSQARTQGGVMERRDFFKVLGGGLFVAIALDDLFDTTVDAFDDQPETGGGRGRGRSGRGDTCIGSYLARRLDHSAREATLWAAAVTSLKLEAEGPVRRSIEDAEERCRELVASLTG